MSTTHSERLAALGLRLPQVPAPVAAYVPAVRSGELVHTSGQLPFTDGALPLTGKVGQGDGLVDPGTAQQLAATCALNAVAAAAEAAGGLDAIEAVVKVVVFVASDPAFTGQPAVANGASELLGRVFGDAGRHARSAVGVSVLPLDSPVEVEVTVRVRG